MPLLARQPEFLEVPIEKLVSRWGLHGQRCFFHHGFSRRLLLA